MIIAINVFAFDIPLDRYTDKGDGESYKAYARALLGEERALAREYDRRVFPGYPTLIAAVSLTGLPVSHSALVIEVLCAGGAAVLAALLFRDVRIGWAMTCLIPHYLINSSMAMSEAPMLAFTLAGLAVALPWHGTSTSSAECPARAISIGVAGILLGFAGLIRPMACFAVMGLFIVLLRRRQWLHAFAVALTSAAVVLLGLLLIHFQLGDALALVRIYANDPGTYAGRLFLWPGESLIMTPSREGATWGKIVYVWAHVLLVGTAIVVLIRSARGPPPRGPPPAPRGSRC